MNRADGYFPHLAGYLEIGIGRVEGWLSATTAAMLGAIAVRQVRCGLAGDLGEIGVHHGKLFLILAAVAQSGERAVAVDLFGDQDRNVDRSGGGDRAVLERNCACYAPEAVVDIIEASSLDLPSTAFEARRFRLFSIDGGHTAAITGNDLRLCERTLLPGGVAALDDILSHHWTGVVSGLADYLASGGTLVPYALVPNKVLLTTTRDAATARAAELRREFSQAWTKTSELFGFGVDVYDECAYYAREDSRCLRLLLAQAEQRAGELAQAVAEAEKRAMHERHEAQRAAASARATEAVIRQSTSWRMTAPLRALARQFRRV